MTQAIRPLSRQHGPNLALVPGLTTQIGVLEGIQPSNEVVGQMPSDALIITNTLVPRVILTVVLTQGIFLLKNIIQGCSSELLRR